MHSPRQSADLPTPQKATGTRSSFHHDLETRASPQAIWGLWSDVGSWPDWDTALESAQLDGAFQSGARGMLKARGSPASPFFLEAVEPGRSYRFVTELPLGGRLVIARTLTAGQGVTRFRHEVRFEGFGGAVLSLVLGEGYRSSLPGVMERLRALAEETEASR